MHYLKEDGAEAQTQGENYIPGVYVKLGNIARFCPIDPVDAAHPLITDGDYILVLPEGTEGSVSKVRLYDEIIVSGQNLYDGSEAKNPIIDKAIICILLQRTPGSAMLPE